MNLKAKQLTAAFLAGVLFTSACPAHGPAAGPPMLLALASESCWAPAVKSAASELAQTMAVQQVVKMRNREAGAEAEFRKLVHLTLSDFHVGSQRGNEGNISCAARASLTLDKKNGGAYRASGQELQFNVYVGEGGLGVTINEADIHRILLVAASNG